jgi:septum site-determining protein MinC
MIDLIVTRFQESIKMGVGFMSDGSVSFKATVNGLVIILHEDSDFDEIYNQIENKVASAGKFFKGASISVKYRGRKLNNEEERKIVTLLGNKTGAEIKSFDEDVEEVSKPQISPNTNQSSKIKIKKYFFNGIDEGITKFYKGTVRSGQLVNYDGNLVIIGDVNPGGEVIATGNVVVMGSLRGIVHAGADGNKEASVIAFNLQPMQLRIADVITRSPDEKGSRNNFIPELAFVRDDAVYIERYLPQR